MPRYAKHLTHTITHNGAYTIADSRAIQRADRVSHIATFCQAHTFANRVANVCTIGFTNPSPNSQSHSVANCHSHSDSKCCPDCSTNIGANIHTIVCANNGTHCQAHTTAHGSPYSNAIGVTNIHTIVCTNPGTFCQPHTFANEGTHSNADNGANQCANIEAD
jgi:hypothetical protein